MLSPLNEFDEEYENPLNKAMILDCSIKGGFMWSKSRDDITSQICINNLFHSDEKNHATDTSVLIGSLPQSPQIDYTSAANQESSNAALHMHQEPRNPQTTSQLFSLKEMDDLGCPINHSF